VEEQARELVEPPSSGTAGSTSWSTTRAPRQVIPHGDLDAVTTDLWRRILDVNLLGTWHLAPGAGHVVSTSSIAGVRPTGSSIPYAVSKAAVNHLTALLAASLGPEIRVNAVAPGLVDTRWTADGGLHLR
jgi:ketoreductase RED2